MWWLQTIPSGPGKCRVIQGSCFPASTVARSDFAEHVGKYYKRWDKSIPEDNAISERQQAGLESARRSPAASRCTSRWCTRSRTGCWTGPIGRD